MEAKDIRIGNLVQDKKYKSPDRITQFFGTEMFELDSPYMEYTDDRRTADIKDFEPIPLTEDWLLKFGFEKENNNYHKYRRHYETDRVKVSICDFSFDATGESFRGFVFLYGQYMDGDGIHIRYVHQLQNLYFALTGKELEIK